MAKLCGHIQMPTNHEKRQNDGDDDDNDGRNARATFLYSIKMSAAHTQSWADNPPSRARLSLYPPTSKQSPTLHPSQTLLCGNVAGVLALMQAIASSRHFPWHYLTTHTHTQTATRIHLRPLRHPPPPNVFTSAAAPGARPQGANSIKCAQRRGDFCLSVCSFWAREFVTAFRARLFSETPPNNATTRTPKHTEHPRWKCLQSCMDNCMDN